MITLLLSLALALPQPVVNAQPCGDGGPGIVLWLGTEESADLSTYGASLDCSPLYDGLVVWAGSHTYLS